MSWNLSDKLTLSAEEAQRLNYVLEACWSVPILKDIEGFIWEALFHYVKGLPMPTNSSKKLFDAVDPSSHIGWSLKTLQCESLKANTTIEFVIQRADIIKKSKILGFFEELSDKSNPEELGRAVIKHWQEKVHTSMESQNVEKGYLVVLAKSKNRKNYVYVEEPLPKFDADKLTWSWTKQEEQKNKSKGSKKPSQKEVLDEILKNDDQNTKEEPPRLGLLATNKVDGQRVLKWYIRQTHVFQYMKIPPDAPRFEIEHRRIDLEVFFNWLMNQKNIESNGKENYSQDTLF